MSLIQLPPVQYERMTLCIQTWGLTNLLKKPVQKSHPNKKHVINLNYAISLLTLPHM